METHEECYCFRGTGRKQRRPRVYRFFFRAAPETPLIWEGLTDRQLCELFKDPQHNNHHTVDGIVAHMNTPLVLWGWNPGEGRTPVPMPKEEFLAKVKEWAAKGVACPK